jgi:hypothetical protein
MIHPHNRLVAPLDDAVLLWAVRRGIVALNTVIKIWGSGNGAPDCLFIL